MIECRLLVDASTFSARAPFTHVQGDLVVKDVCRVCNNGTLSALDGYGKDLYGRYFDAPVHAGEIVSFEYDGDRLIRWLLKLSDNSVRVTRDHFAFSLAIGVMRIPLLVRLKPP